MQEDTNELAYFDYLSAREAALTAAVGSLTVDNVPPERLRIIAQATTDPTIAFAARIAYWKLTGSTLRASGEESGR